MRTRRTKAEHTERLRFPKLEIFLANVASLRRWTKSVTSHQTPLYGHFMYNTRGLFLPFSRGMGLSRRCSPRSPLIAGFRIRSHHEQKSEQQTRPVIYPVYETVLEGTLTEVTADLTESHDRTDNRPQALR